MSSSNTVRGSFRAERFWTWKQKFRAPKLKQLKPTCLSVVHFLKFGKLRESRDLKSKVWLTHLLQLSNALSFCCSLQLLIIAYFMLLGSTNDGRYMTQTIMHVLTHNLSSNPSRKISMESDAILFYDFDWWLCPGDSLEVHLRLKWKKSGSENFECQTVIEVTIPIVLKGH
jgi:hypothetical protein